MNVNIAGFKSTDLTDILVYVEGNHILENKYLSNKLKITEAARDALNKMQEATIMTPELFTKKIEKATKDPDFTTLTIKQKNTIASMLRSQAKITKKEEARFGAIRTIIDKLIHFLQGHGYITNSQWEFKLADRIDSKEADLRECLTHKTPREGKIRELSLEMNGLNENDFATLLEKSFFSTNENSKGEVSRKLLLFIGLDDNKKEQFLKRLCSRQDWFKQAFEIGKGPVPLEEWGKFVSGPLLEKLVLMNPKKLYVAILTEKRFENEFAKYLLSRVIQEELTRKEEYKANRILDEFRGIIDRSDIIPLLSEEQQNKISAG